MNIVVCVKEIIDPEMPAENFKVDPNAKAVVGADRLPIVLNPFDEQAVEAALRLKDSLGARVTVITVGNDVHLEVVKKPLTMGADDLVLVQDASLGPLDSWSTAKVLAAAVRKLGPFDMVLCGRQAADWDAGQVGLGIAALLDVPSVSTARKIEVAGNTATVERVTTSGYEVVEVDLPAVITVSNELGQARYPILARIIESARKKPTVWSLVDLGLETVDRRLELTELFQPVREGTCEIVAGDTPEEAGVNLARRLRQAKLL